MILAQTSINVIRCPPRTRCFYGYFRDLELRLSATKANQRTNDLCIKSVASIENKSRDLLKNVIRSKANKTTLLNLEHLVKYLKVNPIARQQVHKDNGIALLLELKTKVRCEQVLGQIRLALTLLGYVAPVKKRGVCILSLDGGGTRGVMTIEMLKKIQELSNQPIHDLFDLIVGTSTGAILAFLIGIKKKSLTDCRTLYSKLSRDIFSSTGFVGTGKLFLNHAYYDSTKFEEILRTELGDDSTLIDTEFFEGPKVAAVSTLVNEPVLQAFVFRNYCLRSGHKNVYTGTSKHKLWEAVRASTAAPGFFEEFVLDGKVHQDGGILTNNPTALAIHEARTLWPNTPIQAIISIGTGTYHGRSSPRPLTATSLREKLMKIVASATDVEAVHIALQDLVDPSTYVRLNPNMSSDTPLDENRAEVLLQLEKDTRNYIDKFAYKYHAAAKMLRTPKPFMARCLETDEVHHRIQNINHVINNVELPNVLKSVMHIAKLS